MPDNVHERPCSGPEPRQETELESLVKIEDRIGAESRDFYRTAIMTMLDARIPLLVGGAFAFEFYTGISRYTKDFDIFIKAEDVGRVLDTFKSEGYTTEVTAPHWLAKVCAADNFVDIIFGEANGVRAVDEEWFRHTVRHTIFGLDLHLCTAEQMIASKAFVMDRNRYDGADVAHLIRARADNLDWDLLTGHFGEYWHVLLSHLILFGFIYPSERNRIPARVMQKLLRHAQEELKKPVQAGRVCRGTLTSMTQYRVDIMRWGYRDARELKEAV